MKNWKETLSFRLIPVAALLLIAGCGGGSDSDLALSVSTDTAASSDAAADHPNQNSTDQTNITVEVPDACQLFDRMELEQTLGWELRDPEPEDAPPGNSACDIRKIFGHYSTRKYPDPALPELIGFRSLTVSTYPSSAEMFQDFRQLLGEAAEEVTGIGDGAYFYEFDMIYGLVGDKGFTLRIYTDAQTEEDRMLVREMMLTLARQAAANLK